MNLQKDLEQLKNENIIDEATAQRIENYYANQKKEKTPFIFVVFGVLGSILVGMGIILILAHNWDNLSTTVKSIIAFLPLIAGQVLGGYTLWKKSDNTIWKESNAVFLVFAIGASIALISQIYHIPGNMGDFMITWCLLSLPLVYLFKSNTTSLLCLIGGAIYNFEVNYSYYSYSPGFSYQYWVLIIAILPYYLRILDKPSNALNLHHWFISASVLNALSIVAFRNWEWMIVIYAATFSIYYLIGTSGILPITRLLNNAYRILGALGTLIILLMNSFEEFWSEMYRGELFKRSVLDSPEFIGAMVLSVGASSLLYLQVRRKQWENVFPIPIAFILIIIGFAFAKYSILVTIVFNIYLLIVGIYTIQKGINENHFGILNYGLAIITALIICRFFDVDMSFVFRGLLFISVGILCFFLNYMMLKKRRSHES